MRLPASGNPRSTRRRGLATFLGFAETLEARVLDPRLDSRLNEATI
jgi:hypothetical protein